MPPLDTAMAMPSCGFSDIPAHAMSGLDDASGSFSSKYAAPGKIPDIGDVDELLSWYSGVESGSCFFDFHHTTEGSGRTAMATAMLLAVAEPSRWGDVCFVLDGLVRRGLSPWYETASSEHDTVYQELLLHERSLPLLRWCWDQPGAPSHAEASHEQRIRSDRLDALLNEHRQPGDEQQLEQLARLGFRLAERWSDGRSTLDRVLGLNLSAAQWVQHFSPHSNGALQAIHGLRRLASELHRQSPRNPGLYAIALIAGARGEGEEFYFTQSSASKPWALEGWKVAWRELMLEVAQNQDFSGSLGNQEQETHRACLAWARQQTPSALLAGLVLKSTVTAVNSAVFCGGPSTEAFAVPVGWPQLVEGCALAAHFADRIPEGFWLDNDLLLAWQQAGASAARMLLGLPLNELGKWPDALFEEPGFWVLALVFSFRSFYRWPLVIEEALSRDYAWPATPLFMEIAEPLCDTVWGVSEVLERQRAEVNAARLECSLPETQPGKRLRI